MAKALRQQRAHTFVSSTDRTKAVLTDAIASEFRDFYSRLYNLHPDLPNLSEIRKGSKSFSLRFWL